MQKRATIAILIVLIILIAGAITVAAWQLQQGQSNLNHPITYTYHVVNTYPHDTSAFTEGLIFNDGFLYESTGLYGSSSLRQVNLTSGNPLKQYSLTSQYFGEGLTAVNNSLIQLTWQEHIGFVYEKETFAIQGNFSYATEGWGLTYDGNNLIMSDGSDNLYFINPATFEKIGQIVVRDGNQSIPNLNELEYVNGDIYANIWHDQKIAIIDAQTGQITGYINLAGLYQTSDPEAVLNGIAYDQQNNRLFVTGKDWPYLYQITITPKT